MNKNVNVKLATKPTSFPVGTRGGSFYFIIGNQGETAHFSKSTTTAPQTTFANVPTGAYWIEAARLDELNEQALGDVERIEFLIQDESVLIETASVLGITLSDAS